MSHSHADTSVVDVDVRVARRVRLVVACVLLPLIATATAIVVLLWPAGKSVGAEAIRQARASGTITELRVCSMAPTECSIATVRVEDGPGEGADVEAIVSTSSGVRVSTGDSVMMIHRPERPTVYERYEVAEPDRSLSLGLLALVFAAAVILLSRWRGVAALAGLAVCLGGLVLFVLPAIVEGHDPLLVAVSGGSLMTVIALFLTHGLNARTAIAVVGTVAGLALTGVIGWLALRLTAVTGLGSDNVGFLSGYLDGIDLQGLLLAAFMIGALGVLDDVTITQAAVVWELSAADPKASRSSLFAAALRVGQAHVASTANTLVLAYAGAALPLLLLFAAAGLPGDHVVSTGAVAEEIIRTLAGGIGIVVAVPLTTALAAMAVGARTPATPESDEDPDVVLVEAR